MLRYSQCGNVTIFLLLRFYVKSILGILQALAYMYQPRKNLTASHSMKISEFFSHSFLREINFSKMQSRKRGPEFWCLVNISSGKMQKFTKPQFHRCKTCQTSSFWGLSFKTPESQNWISRKICLAGQIAKFPHCARTMMMVLHSMSWNKLEVLSRGGRGERINCSSGSVRTT